MSDTRKYQGYDYKGHKLVITTGEESKTMTLIQEDGTMKEVPYEPRRTGKLTPVPQSARFIAAKSEGLGVIKVKWDKDVKPS